MTTASPQRLPLLDGLRGIAAISVMGYHFGHVYRVETLFERGYLFVDFFFLLSGFVLTLALESRPLANWSARSFIRARIVRLWPMIAIGALCGACVALVTRGQGHLEIALALVLALAMIPVTGVRDVEAFPLNGPQWSLLFELLANAAHALLLRRLSTPILLGLVGLAGIAELLVILHYGSNTRGPNALDWYAGLPRVAFAYGLGICLGRLWRLGRLRQQNHWLVPFLLLSLWPIALYLGNAWLDDATGDALSVLLVMPALFWLAACSPEGRKASPILGAMGQISFPLYAVHLPILMLFASFERSLPNGIAAVMTSLALAALLGRSFERLHKTRTARPRKSDKETDGAPATTLLVERDLRVEA